MTIGQLLQPLPELRGARTCGRAGAGVPGVRYWTPSRCPHLRHIVPDRRVSRSGTVVFQGAGSAAYRLTFTVSPWAVLMSRLQTEPAASKPELLPYNHTCAKVHLACSYEAGRTRFAHLAPFLDFIVPIGVDLQNRWDDAGHVDVHGSSGSFPSRPAWRAPTAVVSGTAALTLTLPKFAGVGDNLLVRFDGK